MSKPVLVAAAAVSALAISACGGASKPTLASTCRHGDAIGARFNADMQRYMTVASTNPIGADPSHVHRDLVQMGDTVTTLMQEDSSPTDLQGLAVARRGLRDLEAALTELHAGNVVGAYGDMKHGAVAVRSLAGSSLAVCKGISPS